MDRSKVRQAIFKAPRQITYLEIAEGCGVAQSVISRFLRDENALKDDTVYRIQEGLKKLGLYNDEEEGEPDDGREG